MVNTPTAEEPVLSVLQAHALAGLFAASYVGSLYVSQRARITYASNNANEQARERERRRDDPDVIKARLVIVSLITTLSCAVVFVVAWTSTGQTSTVSDSALHAARLLGLSFSNVILPALIAPVLFAGPLYVCYLGESLPLQRNWSWQWSVAQPLTSLNGLRNYVVAPITEEAVFRACILAVYHLAGSSQYRMIFASPLWFGIAHAHHGWEVYHRLGCTKLAAQRAILAVVFQTAFTTLFGFHCAFLFLRTGSLLPPILSHMFCNFMGLPGFGADLAAFPLKRNSIAFAYLLGVAGYVYFLPRWTLTSDSLYWHGL